MEIHDREKGIPKHISALRTFTMISVPCKQFIAGRDDAAILPDGHCTLQSMTCEVDQVTCLAFERVSFLDAQRLDFIKFLHFGLSHLSHHLIYAP